MTNTLNNNQYLEQISQATNDLRSLNDSSSKDAITMSQMNNLHKQIDLLTKKIEDIEVSKSRPQFGNFGISTPHSINVTIENKSDDEYNKAFLRYLRQGVEPMQNDLYSLSGYSTSMHGFGSNASSYFQTKDAGFEVSKNIYSTVYGEISSLSTIRKLADVVTISGSSYEMVTLPNDIAAGWSMNDIEHSNHSPILKRQIPVHEIYAQPKATQQMLDDSRVNIENWLSNQLIDVLLNAEDAAFICGDGDGKPSGILNALNDKNRSGNNAKNNFKNEIALTNSGDFLKDDSLKDGMAKNNLYSKNNLLRDSSRNFEGFNASIARHNQDLSFIESVYTNQEKTITADDIIALYYSLDSKYSNNANFVIGHEMAYILRTLKNSQGMYIWEPSVKYGQPNTILGKEVFVSRNMPSVKGGVLNGSATNGINVINSAITNISNNGVEANFGSGTASNTPAIIFGDFRKGYQVIDRQEIRVLRDPFTHKPYIKFYATKRVGGAVNDAEALKVLVIA